jgi:AAA domain/NrS-1  polymerase HBD domain
MLYSGVSDGYDSPSEADCALVAAFAFYTRDEDQLARILRRSGRAREKLNREDYVQRTVAKALEGCFESYDWSRIARRDHPARRAGANVSTERPGRHIELTRARLIRSERVRWAWRDRLPLRSLSVIAGEKGLGKSILTNARIPAEATRGRLPGELEGVSVDVLVCSGEDDWRSVVKPRLIAHDADLDRVHRISVVDDDGESVLTLPDDLPLLEAEVERLRAGGRAIGLIVIDPIGAFLSAATDTHRDSSVRRALAPLAALADRLDLVVLVVMHLTKDESSRLINRISGAGAFANAARSVLVLARSPDDPEGEQGRERVLVHVGSNWGRYAPTLAARIEAREVDLDDGSRASVGYLHITGETDISVDDLQRGRDENGGVDVEEAICAALADGPRPSREVKAHVVEVGCGKRTVERAAERMAERGELVIESGGFPRTTTWTLCFEDREPPRSRANHTPTVAPATNTQSGATDSHAVVAEDSAISRANGAPLERAVATDGQKRISANAQAITWCCADGGERADDGRCYGRYVASDAESRAGTEAPQDAA